MQIINVRYLANQHPFIRDRKMKHLSILLLGLSTALFFAGCGGETEGKDDHGHDHDHGEKHADDHDDHIGGAHIDKVKLDDAPFNLSLQFAGGDTVIFKAMDKDFEKEVEIECTEILVTDAGGENTFKVKAVEPKDGKAKEFELHDELLYSLLHDAQPTISVTVGEETYKKKFVHEH